MASQLTSGLLVSLAIICFYIYWFFRKSFEYWKNKNLPYIKPVVPFGNTLNLYLGKITLGELFAHSYLELKKRGEKHGGMYYFSTPIYIPTDPEIIKNILIRDFEHFPNRGFYLNPAADPLTHNIFFIEDAKWRTLRSKLPVAFTTSKMRKYFSAMVELSEQLVKNLESPRGQPINVRDQFSRFTADVASVCFFGMQSNIMKQENDLLLKHGKNFFDLQFGLYKNTFVICVPRPILLACNFRVLPKDTEEYILKTFKNIWEFRKTESVARNDLAGVLGKLTEIQEDDKDFIGQAIKEPIGLVEYTANIYSMFSAGFETTSSSLTFAIHELAKNQDIQTKLRAEIQQVLSRYDNEITYDAVMEMKYLENVVDETLRLYPVFPVVARVCKKDYKVPGTDVTLDKNTFVLVSNLGIHRDPDYYPDPEKFNPDRFSIENKHTRPFVANIPFGEGPRMCIGKRFGLLQMKVILTAIVRDCHISLDRKTKKGCKFSPWELVLRKTGDIWIHFQKIQNKQFNY